MSFGTSVAARADVLGESRKRREGLTLVELMVVLAVMGILVSAALPSMGEGLADRRVSMVARDFENPVDDNTDNVYELTITATDDDDNGDNSGSAYIFERNAGVIWPETQKLLAGDGALGDFLGFSIAISGELAIVGAHVDDGGTGSASSSSIILSSSTARSSTAKVSNFTSNSSCSLEISS